MYFIFKLLQDLLLEYTFKLPLKPALNIAFITSWLLYFSAILSFKFAAITFIPCVGTDTLFTKFGLSVSLYDFGMGAAEYAGL